jgi:hypothetical protein
LNISWVPQYFDTGCTSFPEPQSSCSFGSSGFDGFKSSTFVNYPDNNFKISYGDGESLTGAVGFDTVTVGGIGDQTGNWTSKQSCLDW